MGTELNAISWWQGLPEAQRNVWKERVKRRKKKGQRVAVISEAYRMHFRDRIKASRSHAAGAQNIASALVVFVAVCAGLVFSTGMAHAAPYEHWYASSMYRPMFSLRWALPNPSLTPGARNPQVTQGNIRETICRRGFTRSIRPPEWYTERLKRAQIRQYGYSDYRLSAYAEDHLIPLELGGSPTSPRNLWPEPDRVQGGWSSFVKDHLEDRLNHLVCAGRVPLALAQRAIATDWIAAYRRYVGPVPRAQRWRSRW